jgi:hypothetical protein
MAFIRHDPREVLSCGIFYSILVGSTTLSNLFLAANSIDRGIMILHPTRYRSLVTQSRVMIRIVLITLVVILLLVPHRYYLYYNPRVTFFLCDFYSSDGHRRMQLFSLFHATFFVVMPSVIVCISALILLHNRCTHKRKYRNHLSVNARRMHNRAIVIVIASVVLFLSVLPSCILQVFIVRERFYQDDPRCSTQWRLYRILQYCFLIVSSTNYSIKFYVHLLMSTRFRRSFVQLITCQSRAHSNGLRAISEANKKEQHLLPIKNQTRGETIEL